MPSSPSLSFSLIWISLSSDVFHYGRFIKRAARWHFSPLRRVLLPLIGRAGRGGTSRIRSLVVTLRGSAYIRFTHTGTRVFFLFPSSSILNSPPHPHPAFLSRVRLAVLSLPPFSRAALIILPRSESRRGARRASSASLTVNELGLVLSLSFGSNCCPLPGTSSIIAAIPFPL